MSNNAKTTNVPTTPTKQYSIYIHRIPGNDRLIFNLFLVIVYYALVTPELVQVLPDSGKEFQIGATRCVK